MSIKKTVCSVMAIISVVTGGMVATATNADPIGEVVINGETIGTLFVSQRSLEVIGNAEGCRRNPYKCPAGLKTDGIGNTHGKIGKAKTDDEIAADWVRNIISAQECLQTNTRLETLSQGEKDSLVSFIFNTGCTTYKRNKDGSRTSIATLAAMGDMNAACKQLKRWVYAGGNRLNGLVTRRNIEYEMCIGG